jgi:hypothetical protein
VWLHAEVGWLCLADLFKEIKFGRQVLWIAVTKAAVSGGA